MLATPLTSGLMIVSRFCHARLRRDSDEDLPLWGAGTAFRLLSRILVWTAWKVLYVILQISLVYAYPPLRLYLWMESLVILRSPVQGTYETNNWTSLIPHFTKNWILDKSHDSGSNDFWKIEYFDCWQDSVHC